MKKLLLSLMLLLVLAALPVLAEEVDGVDWSALGGHIAAAPVPQPSQCEELWVDYDCAPLTTSTRTWGSSVCADGASRLTWNDPWRVVSCSEAPAWSGKFVCTPFSQRPYTVDANGILPELIAAEQGNVPIALAPGSFASGTIWHLFRDTVETYRVGVPSAPPWPSPPDETRLMLWRLTTSGAEDTGLPCFVP